MSTRTPSHGGGRGAFSLAAFLGGKSAYIVTTLAVSCFAAFIIYMAFGEPYAAALIPAIFLCGAFASLMPEYFAKRRFYGELRDVSERLDRAYLLPEIIGEPDFYEGKILRDTLRRTGKSMGDEVAVHARDSLEYREYIELWVHEIKTPIAAAKLVCEASRDKDALLELHRIELLVEQALYYARSGSVEKDYIIKAAPLSELVGDTLKGYADYLIAQKISVRTEGLDRTVFTDAKWIRFILRQLIDNSVKYGCTTLTFSCEQQDNSVALSMSDDGAGIPEHDLNRVFDKGFTGENGRVYVRSTGMGLYLCKKLCDKLGLSIAISSTHGTGATVKITFPVAPDSPNLTKT